MRRGSSKKKTKVIKDESPKIMLSDIIYNVQAIIDGMEKIKDLDLKNNKYTKSNIRKRSNNKIHDKHLESRYRAELRKSGQDSSRALDLMGKHCAKTHNNWNSSLNKS